MGKAAMKQANYVIVAELKTSAIVEESDIVGAVFGQTEGLLGDQLNLKELTNKGKVSRLNIDLKEDGKSAKIEIPSSMNATDTSLLAASLETIEKVGPSNADIKVKHIRDERASKRDYIVKRAKQLLKQIEKDSPDINAIEDDLKAEIRAEAVTKYNGFFAGPDAQISDEIILVEGKADVENLLRHGVKNAVAVGGTSIPEGIEEISSGKTVTAFVDGDRGGDLILKELKNKNIPRYYAKAPEKTEVEELNNKQVHEKLRDKEPVKYAETKEISEEDEPDFKEKFKELIGTRAAETINQNRESIERVPASNIEQVQKNAYALIIDGEINQKAVDKAEEISADYVAGKSRSKNANSSKVRIITKKN